MIGEIVECGGVHPGAAPQYQPGDVGAVDSEDLEKGTAGARQYWAPYLQGGG